jgi:hypothetical protein
VFALPAGAIGDIVDRRRLILFTVSNMQSFSVMVDFWRFGPPLETVRA